MRSSSIVYITKSSFIVAAIAVAAAFAGSWVGSSFTASRNSVSVRPYADYQAYDECLARHGGNTVQCEAHMRMLFRRAEDQKWKKAMKRNADKLLAAGFDKKEVAEWALDKGFSEKFAPTELTGIIQGLTYNDVGEVLKIRDAKETEQ